MEARNTNPVKVVILAGGYGTRLCEETDIRPKPMVEIGGKPILWHIMKIYSSYGFNDFIVLLGYKGYVIKEYFANYFLHQSDVMIDLKNNKLDILNNTSEPWSVTLLDTGVNTMTGGRILQAQPFLNDQPFMLTYGDGVANVDISSLLNFHSSHGKTLTATIIQPEGRYGTVDAGSDGAITEFIEKPKGDGAWINGGFFVCEQKIFDYLSEGDQTIFEKAPMEKLTADRELYAYKHNEFWKCMDTLRDRTLLEDLWAAGEAPWKVW